MEELSWYTFYGSAAIASLLIVALIKLLIRFNPFREREHTFKCYHLETEEVRVPEMDTYYGQGDYTYEYHCKHCKKQFNRAALIAMNQNERWRCVECGTLLHRANVQQDWTQNGIILCRDHGRRVPRVSERYYNPDGTRKSTDQSAPDPLAQATVEAFQRMTPPSGGSNAQHPSWQCPDCLMWWTVSREAHQVVCVKQKSVNQPPPKPERPVIRRIKPRRKE